MRISDEEEPIAERLPQLVVVIICCVVTFLLLKHLRIIDAVYLDDEVGYLAKASIFNEIPLRHPSKYHFGVGLLIAPAGMIFQFHSHSLAQAFLFANFAFLFLNVFLANRLLLRCSAAKQFRISVITISTLGPTTLPFIFSQFPTIALQTLTLLIVLSYNEDNIVPGEVKKLGTNVAKIFCLFVIGYLIHPVALLLGVGLILALTHLLVTQMRGKEPNKISDYNLEIARISLIAIVLVVAKFIGDHLIEWANGRLARKNYLSASGYGDVWLLLKDLLQPGSVVDMIYGFSGVGLAVIACTGLAPFGLRLASDRDINWKGSSHNFEGFMTRFLAWTLLVFMLYGATMVDTQNQYARLDYLFYGRYVAAVIPLLLLSSLALRRAVRESYVLVTITFTAALLVGSLKFANEWIVAPVNFLSFSPYIFFGEQLPGFYYGLLLLLIVLFLLANRSRDTLKTLLIFTLLSASFSTFKWIDFRTINGLAYSARLSDLDVLFEAFGGTDQFADGMPILFIDKGGPDADLYRIRQTAGGNFELRELAFSATDSYGDLCGAPVVLTVGGSGSERFSEFAGMKILLMDKYHRLALGTPDENQCGVMSNSDSVDSQMTFLAFQDFVALEG